jgi:hypothetical protein
MSARSIGYIKQTNRNIVEVLRRDSEVLARIQDSFHTIIMARNKDGLQPIQVTCFYEQLPLPGVGFVRIYIYIFIRELMLIVDFRSFLRIRRFFRVIFRSGSGTIWT